MCPVHLLAFFTASFTKLISVLALGETNTVPVWLAPDDLALCIPHALSSEDLEQKFKPTRSIPLIPYLKSTSHQLVPNLDSNTYASLQEVFTVV